ncbi:lytic transglycosylase [Psychromonas sp. Urea-02u-13]|uniref:lytic transglycosylase n=1 Tax=Psychromonas sp. Urea-02u-13 TaxID=2058326 RepID=UPI000C32D555|nr:LysM peptidoglycan-binding domain-containing protein [Psychromonas sp. Urea-02u-13]PKG40614.1 lytic transglycosylase [Psychromonas sp. Urea-02u-13]
MKLFFPFLLLFLVSACQITPTEELSESETTSVAEQEAIEMLSEDDEEGLSNLVKDKTITEGQPEEAVTELKHKNIWLKLAEGFEFEVPDNSRVAKQRDYYLRHPKYLKQVSKRAEPFLYLIVEQIEAKGLPLELALLPVVESTFDPFAYSPASASGLWQFMPVTGERFGLQQDWWYDGRRDVYASTTAALRYMEILHNYLGDDWLYAFAAYNSGEGRVKRAVQKNKKQNKPVDYWNLSLPTETENYVPKLLALVDVLRNHKKYGVELPFIENEQVLTYVDTGSQLDLAYAAQLAELTVAEIQLLNPAFNHWATSPDGPHKLLIPTVVAKEFVEKLDATGKNERIRWARYKVRSGDSLSVIAHNHDTTTSVLKQNNNISGSFIKIGQPLLIPLASESQQDYLYSQAQRFERFEAKNSKGKRKITHTVVEGDTLWDISRLYKVTSKEIAKWNKTTTKKTLRLGENLTIWKPAKSTNNKTRRLTYKVRSGDSLGGIAQKFNVKTTDLVRWNKLQKQKYIQPGQKLLVHVGIRKSRG